MDNTPKTITKNKISQNKMTSDSPIERIISSSISAHQMANCAWSVNELISWAKW